MSEGVVIALISAAATLLAAIIGAGATLWAGKHSPECVATPRYTDSRPERPRFFYWWLLAGVGNLAAMLFVMEGGADGIFREPAEIWPGYALLAVTAFIIALFRRNH